MNDKYARFATRVVYTQAGPRRLPAVPPVHQAKPGLALIAVGLVALAIVAATAVALLF